MREFGVFIGALSGLVGGEYLSKTLTEPVPSLHDSQGAAILEIP